MYRGGATETPPSLQWTALTGGVNSTPANADFQIGWDLFANVDTVTIDICIDGGTVNDTMQKYIIDNIALVRKDCIVICNCLKADVVGATASAATSALVTYASATLNRSTNYAALYSNWKYQYDRYADKYRWIPISGDIAGVIARTDFDRDPWFAPAGFNRGAIKNYSKLAYAPNRAQRDTLYKNRINPVLEIAGQGAIILGQKTLQTRPSAFDRLTVRRLFLILERNIQQMAQFFMFEKNNDRTRSQFVSTVTPYLERIKGAEGIYDYAVICDSSNNGSSVVDANQFIADIYIKPAKDVEFIELNFVAVGTNVEFSEIVKQ
jgi:phage tail sheath protein FI